jgi:DNA-binding response OmpR family regulator
MTILIVEDNADLAYGLRNNLEIEGYQVAVAADGLAGLDQARSLKPDLIVLDLMLPGLDGYRVLKTLRNEALDMPVLILTAHGQEADKVRGFRLGADDYVTKPFGILELLERVAALLRRAARPERDAAARQRERFGDIEIDAATEPCIVSAHPSR